MIGLLMASDIPLIEDIDVARSRIRIRAGSGFPKGLIQEDFFAEYEGVSLEAVPRWILEMPFLLNVAPVVWLSGERFVVDEMDEALMKSLEGIKQTFRGMYPHLLWGGELHANDIVQHRRDLKPGDDQGPLTILFTGGVDSTHTTVRHAGRSQILVTVWGSEVALDNPGGWLHVRTMCLQHAKRHGNHAIFIRSNLRRFMSFPQLTKLAPNIPNWWTHIQHGLGLCGAAAPAMAAAGSRRLLMSATHTQLHRESWGSRPDVDGALRWGEASVSHEGYESPRHQKMVEIIDHVHATGGEAPYLRVCFAYPYGSGANCGRCEKCLRAVSSLMVEGEDPRAYGFRLSPDRAAALVRRKFARYAMGFSRGKTLFWQEIQARARSSLWEGSGIHMVGDMDLRPFLRWLVSMDFDRYHRRWRPLGALRAAAVSAIRRFPSIENLVRRSMAAVRDRKR